MEIPRHWRLKAQRYRLEGLICPVCGQLTFPPRPVCPDCTAQPGWVVAEHEAEWPGCGLSALPTSIRNTGIESHIRYRIVERMIG